jgi:outer membrane protein assembly factor BamB
MTTANRITPNECPRPALLFAPHTLAPAGAMAGCRWVGALLLSFCLTAGCQPSGDGGAPADDGNSTAQRATPTSQPPAPSPTDETETRYVALTASEPVIEADPRDWLYWRGPTYDGVSHETGLVDDFDARGGSGSNVAWKREDLGGRSTPVVMDGKVYTLCRAEPETPFEGERVVCVDAATGETIWENRFNVYLSDVPDTRVGWSAVVADPETGTVFALGVCGLFQCFDAKTGEVRWSVPMHERFGLLSTYGGRTNFPVIVDDLVLVSAVFINWGEKAKPADGYVAFDKRSGDVVWFEATRVGPEDTTYSGATVAVLNQQKSLVFGSGDGGIWSFQPRTGRSLWKCDISRRGVNTPPLVVGDMVIAAHSEENIVGTSMGAVIAIDTTAAGAPLKPAANLAQVKDLTQTGIKWRADELMDGRSQPLLVGNRLWVFDDRAKLWLLDDATGAPLRGRQAALGRMMRASPLYADGKVYALEANGRWAIYRSGQEGAEEVSKGRLPSGEEVAGSPSCSHGRVYFQSTGALYALQDPSKTAGYEPPPAAPSEPDVAEDSAPAQLQIVPAEILMRPGEQQPLSVRWFNSRGQLLGAASDVQFQLEGPGSVSPAGVFTAPADAGHAATIIHARVGDVAGTARVRIVPPLPWHFDFDDGQIPVTWVGARYRHVPLDDDLFNSLNQTNPRAAQLYIYLHSGFVNSGLPRQVFDNSTPLQKWAAFQRFLGIDTTDLEEARQQIDPALQILVDQGVLAARKWEAVPGVGIRLSVEKGGRGYEGNVVMTKITTIPKGTRSRCWFGPSDLSNYTIQADVRGDIKDGKLPDIGLIAQGYTFDMQGESQTLQIRSWDAQLRMARTMPFSWQPRRWYTMKFRASVVNDQAILLGKVWPRGEAEPAEWMLEASDQRPVRSGSPGLFGNAKDAEIFLDNVSVTAN